MDKSKNKHKICRDISIALCTCEGSFFLPIQLESLLSQSLLPAELVISDDSSTDNTVKIVETFAEKAPFEVRLVVNDKRLGAIQNFNQAMELCRGRYIALCDQDDIWLPERLANAYQAMYVAEKRFGSSIPLLVHSDLKVVDANCDLVSPSFMKMHRIRHIKSQPLNKLLAQNFVTGNTVLINQPLLKVALPLSNDAKMHDWWLALVAAALGKIIFIEKPTVLYRQHDRNLIGASSFISLKSFKKVVDLAGLEKEVIGAIKQAEALQSHLHKMNYDFPTWLDDYLLALKKGRVIAFITALRYGVLKQGISRNIFYLGVILKGTYIRYFD